jgi:hypothetical protein
VATERQIRRQENVVSIGRLLDLNFLRCRSAEWRLQVSGKAVMHDETTIDDGYSDPEEMRTRRVRVVTELMLMQHSDWI